MEKSVLIIISTDIKHLGTKSRTTDMINTRTFQLDNKIGQLTSSATHSGDKLSLQRTQRWRLPEEEH